MNVLYAIQLEISKTFEDFRTQIQRNQLVRQHEWEKLTETQNRRNQTTQAENLVPPCKSVWKPPDPSEEPVLNEFLLREEDFPEIPKLRQTAFKCIEKTKKKDSTDKGKYDKKSEGDGSKSSAVEIIDVEMEKSWCKIVGVSELDNNNTEEITIYPMAEDKSEYPKEEIMKSEMIQKNFSTPLYTEDFVIPYGDVVDLSDTVEFLTMEEISERMAKASPEEIIVLIVTMNAQLCYEFIATEMKTKQGNGLIGQGKYNSAVENSIFDPGTFEGELWEVSMHLTSALETSLEKNRTRALSSGTRDDNQEIRDQVGAIFIATRSVPDSCASHIEEMALVQEVGLGSNLSLDLQMGFQLEDLNDYLEIQVNDAQIKLKSASSSVHLYESFCYSASVKYCIIHDKPALTGIELSLQTLPIVFHFSISTYQKIMQLISTISMSLTPSDSSASLELKANGSKVSLRPWPSFTADFGTTCLLVYLEDEYIEVNEDLEMVFAWESLFWAYKAIYPEHFHGLSSSKREASLKEIQSVKGEGKLDIDKVGGEASNWYILDYFRPATNDIDGLNEISVAMFRNLLQILFIGLENMVQRLLRPLEPLQNERKKFVQPKTPFQPLHKDNLITKRLDQVDFFQEYSENERLLPVVKYNEKKIQLVTQTLIPIAFPLVGLSASVVAMDILGGKIISHVLMTLTGFTLMALTGFTSVFMGEPKIIMNKVVRENMRFTIEYYDFSNALLIYDNAYVLKVHGSQRILWELEGYVVVCPPMVHQYARIVVYTFLEEKNLPGKEGRIVKFLVTWRLCSFEEIMNLSSVMVKEESWTESATQSIANWLQNLLVVGYQKARRMSLELYWPRSINGHEDGKLFAPEKLPPEHLGVKETGAEVEKLLMQRKKFRNVVLIIFCFGLVESNVLEGGSLFGNYKKDQPIKVQAVKRADHVLILEFAKKYQMITDVDIVDQMLLGAIKITNHIYTTSRQGTLAVNREMKNQNILKNTFIYNMLIVGWAWRVVVGKAADLLLQMEPTGNHLSDILYKILLKGLSKKGGMKEAIEILKGMIVCGHCLISSVCNALINGFIRQGEVQSALRLRNNLKIRVHLPDLGSYGLIIIQPSSQMSMRQDVRDKSKSFRRFP